MGIFRSASRRASATLAAVGMLAGCGGGSRPTDTPPAVTPVRTLALGQTWVLESSALPPADTTDTLIAGQARHILLRAPAPDNTTLADVYFGETAFRAPPGTRIPVALHPRPGVYGVDISTATPLADGGSITFKYAMHFSAPAGALQQYGTPRQVEGALAIGLIAGDQITLLATRRPAADNLEADFTTAGSYVVAGPR